MADVVMPQMGESIFEGTITKWLKKPGDRIERDEPLFEISTDKVDAEIPAPSAGVLKEIKVTEGQTVPVQTVVAVIESGDGAAAAPAKPKAEAKAASAAAAPSKVSPQAKPEQGEAKPAPAAPAPAASAAAAQPAVAPEENEDGASESSTGKIEEAAGSAGDGRICVFLFRNVGGTAIHAEPIPSIR